MPDEGSIGMERTMMQRRVQGVLVYRESYCARAEGRSKLAGPHLGAALLLASVGLLAGSCSTRPDGAPSGVVDTAAVIGVLGLEEPLVATRPTTAIEDRDLHEATAEYEALAGQPGDGVLVLS